MQEIEGRICPPPEGFIAIVVSRFNASITKRLLDGALAKLRQHKVRDSDIRVVWVPGAFEVPFIANYFARLPDCLAVICLGAVIKGETTHDQHINRSISMAIGEIAAKHNTPVIFGIITCDTVEQADARSGLIESVKDKVLDPAPGNKGAEAAEAALEMIDLMTELPKIPPFPDFADFKKMPATKMLMHMIGMAGINGIDDDDDDDDFDDDDDDDFDDDDDVDDDICEEENDKNF